MLTQKTFVVYGVAENVCVNFAVKGLLERGKEVYVVTDAIKGLPGIPACLEDWKNIGAKTVTSNEIESLLYIEN